MSTLVVFLTARWAEIEAIAAAASTYGADWRFGSGGVYPSDERHHPGAIVGGVWGELENEYGEHIAANDPAHVLADIAAKRKILALHAVDVKPTDTPPFDAMTGERLRRDYSVECAVCGWASLDPTSACETLRLLAEPFRHHPDYDESWRP